MTREEADFIGAMNMCDEISNEAYKKIMCHCEEQEPCEDAISREAAIRWVKTECNPYGKPTIDFESGKKVIEHLKQMPSVTPKPKTVKWIPVSEKMPEEGKTVMASTNYGIYPEAKYSKKYGWKWPWEVGEDYWTEIVDSVEAWMPLPEPYKAEGSDTE
jgi:hypothetical protein